MGRLFGEGSGFNATHEMGNFVPPEKSLEEQDEEERLTKNDKKEGVGGKLRTWLDRKTYKVKGEYKPGEAVSRNSGERLVDESTPESILIAKEEEQERESSDLDPEEVARAEEEIRAERQKRLEAEVEDSNIPEPVRGAPETIGMRKEVLINKSDALEKPNKKRRFDKDKEKRKEASSF